MGKRYVDYFLADKKYMLKLLVSLMIRYKDGADVNRQVINT